MKYIYLLFSFLLVSCGESTASPTERFSQEPSFSTIDEVINNYPKIALSEANGESIIENQTSFLKNDGNLLESDIALALLVTILDPGKSGSKQAHQILAVFSKKQNGYVFRDKRLVGGSEFRNTKLSSISYVDVSLSVDFYHINDPHCCPSMKGEISYSLENYGELEETFMRIK